MNDIIKKYTSISLIKRILIALFIGAFLGLTVPSLEIVSLLGTLFVGALKSVAPILVFILVMSSLANAGGGLGSRFAKVITLYVSSTLISALIAVSASFLFPVTVSLNAGLAQGKVPDGIGAVLTSIFKSVVANPVSSLSDVNYIAILFWATVFGALMKTAASDTTKLLVSDFAKIVSLSVAAIIQFAPFGVCGLVYDAVSTSGLNIFYDYGMLVAELVVCILIAAFITNPLIVFFCLGKNPYPLVFKVIRESALTAFFTRSSAANIPVNLTLCKSLGLDKELYSVSIPLGATINMNGAAIVISIMSLTAAHTLGIHVDFLTALLLCVICSLAAAGSSGVAGGSLLLIPMGCSLLGISNDISMQMVAVGFIIGVIQDSMETALNSSSDVLFTATAELMEKKDELWKI